MRRSRTCRRLLLLTCHRRPLQVKNDGQSLDEELSEVREELERQSMFIRSAFLYYSMKDGTISKAGGWGFRPQRDFLLLADYGIVVTWSRKGCVN